VPIPDRSWFDPTVGATLHTGYNAIQAAEHMPGNVPMAADIETPGLNTFTINCITVAWTTLSGETHAVLLDPRDLGHRAMWVDMLAKTPQVMFHNAPFDVPILHHNQLMPVKACAKVLDTIIHARMAFPDSYESKSLENLAVRHLDLSEFKGGLHLAFKAAGHKTQDAGYENMTIESPIYRLGAMVDTVVTLKLEPILRRKVHHWLTDHPFRDFGATTVSEANEILERHQKVNRIMLRRSAVGLAVDPAYLDTYREMVDVEKQQAVGFLAQHFDDKGDPLRGGASKGLKIVEWLERHGELPPNYPRTGKTRKLSAKKDDLDTLDHPLAKAQRFLAQVEKIEQYITKVQTQYELTGRCHPQVNILGASQTGRMSYNSPEIHQFSEKARPIIADDGQGLTSIDWSQIEPVTMALMAKDAEFLRPFENGADLYEPLVRATGQPRKVAKVVLLAGMYGQSVASLAREIGHTEASAAQIRRQMMSAMPECAKWMAKVTSTAERYARVITAGGRILPVGGGGQYAYKSVNHVVQGSAYDVLADSVIRLEEDGLGDHFQLAMHDELVVDTPVAEEAQKIMATCPTFLEKWAGRSLTLRTDRSDMGHCWLKV